MTYDMLVLFLSTDCSPRCSEFYQPVCGTDGKTYNNMCELKHAKCSSGNVAYLHDGCCESKF